MTQNNHDRGLAKDDNEIRAKKVKNIFSNYSVVNVACTKSLRSYPTRFHKNWIK